jgi:hypothetical protein
MNEAGEPEMRGDPRAMAEFLRLLATAGAPRGSASTGATTPAGGPRDATDVLAFLIGAWLAYATSGLRYWGHVIEAWSVLLPSLVRTVAEGAGPADADGTRRIFVDELRARLRELTEYPAQESRRLQAEFDRLVAALWPAPPSAPGESYWRRWQAKP